MRPNGPNNCSNEPYDYPNDLDGQSDELCLSSNDSDNRTDDPNDVRNGLDKRSNEPDGAA